MLLVCIGQPVSKQAKWSCLHLWAFDFQESQVGLGTFVGSQFPIQQSGAVCICAHLWAANFEASQVGPWICEF
jgi:hypothetical protein